MLFVNKLVWDEWNTAHIARHGVSQAEVEEVCSGEPMIEQGYSERMRLVGPSLRGRMLSVVLAPKDKDFYYPVTARPASRKERRKFQLQKEVKF